MNRQHRLIRSRLKAVCAAAAAADADHQRTIAQLHDTQRHLLVLNERLRVQAADREQQQEEETVQPAAAAASREEVRMLRSSCQALRCQFEELYAMRGQLLAAPREVAEAALTVQEAMRRSSSSEALRQARALLAEEQELKAIAVARYRKEMVQRKAMYNHLMELS